MRARRGPGSRHRGWALAIAVGLVLAACSVRKPIGEQCDLNTDCEDPYVCRLSRCRNWCSGDRDCPLGAYCAINNEGLGACLFPEEEQCTPADPSGCGEGLACTPAGACRSACLDDEGCLWTGRCIEGFCVDVTSGGPLGPDGGGDGLDGGTRPDGSIPACFDEELCNAMDDDCDGRIDEGGDAWCDERSNATGECRDGACRLACDDGFADCDGVQRNGCETDVRVDAASCGACGNACPALEGSVATCMGGFCAPSVCQPQRGDCDGDPLNGCEAQLAIDDAHCGACGRACGLVDGGAEQCVEGVCVVACGLGFGDCNGDAVDGCETPTSREEAHCGVCGRACSAGQVCAEGRCVPPPFPSTGTTAFEPTTDTALRAGIHEFSSIHIPAGVTVRIDSSLGTSGTLELYASGDIVIDGSIDVSGAQGGAAYPSGFCSPSGGATGDPAAVGVLIPSACSTAALGGGGAAGGDSPDVVMGCGLGGRNGGGNGTALGGGGGGGGFAGGGGGGGTSFAAGAGGSASGDTGGMAGPACMAGGGGVAPGIFAGEDGSAAGGCFGAGGGGGSIGASAAADLAVRSTFRSGSGGGGGGGGSGSSGAGGGGGGGALRLASATRIVVRGTLRADGGNGPRVIAGAGGGGGGSGGLVYLSAPELEMGGTVSVLGGLGSEAGERDGGDGGVGRIRVSTDPDRCSGSGSWLGASFTCDPTVTPAAGQVYVGVYPN